MCLWIQDKLGSLRNISGLKMKGKVLAIMQCIVFYNFFFFLWTIISSPWKVLIPALGFCSLRGLEKEPRLAFLPSAAQSLLEVVAWWTELTDTKKHSLQMHAVVKGTIKCMDPEKTHSMYRYKCQLRVGSWLAVMRELVRRPISSNEKFIPGEMIRSRLFINGLDFFFV